MNANDETPAEELFLVIEELSEQLDSLLPRLRRLSQAPEAGLLVGVDALYRADKDLALLCLRFHEGLGRDGRKRVIRLACKGGVPVLDPLKLTETDKDLFYQQHLRRYAVRIDDKNSPNSAIDALGQLLGLIELRAQSEHDALPPGQGSATRLDTNRPVHEESDARGGRTALGSESDAGSTNEFCAETTEELAKPEELSPSIDLDGLALGPAGKPSDVFRQVGKAARGKKRRASTRLETIPARPTSLPGLALALAAPSRAPSPSLGPKNRRGSDAPGLANTLQVRFARGDCWFSARPRNLSLRQIRMAASAAPPLTSSVQVEVSLGEFVVCVPGIVVEVVNTEVSADGSTSFRVELGKLDRFQLESLATILREAQARGVALSPPPARKSRRFAVTWPIAVVSGDKRISADALDVSAHGLFVATTSTLDNKHVTFGIPLDTNEVVIRGRARIVRQVTEQMAEERQLRRGYGLFFEALDTTDHRNYEHFLVRVRERSQRHVVVGGTTLEATALAECLQSAGYAVSRVGSAARLHTAATWTNGRPDVAILGTDERTMPMEAGFKARGIPVLHVGSDSATNARKALDRHLSV